MMPYSEAVSHTKCNFPPTDLLLTRSQGDAFNRATVRFNKAGQPSQSLQGKIEQGFQVVSDATE